MDDVSLKARVVEELGRLPLVGASMIDVTAADGRVTLTGKVINPVHRMLIGFAVPKLKGVKNLALHLEVANDLSDSNSRRPIPTQHKQVPETSFAQVDGGKLLDIEFFDWLDRSAK